MAMHARVTTGRKGWVAVLGLALALVPMVREPAMAAGRAIQRPVSDWRAAQGSMTAAQWEALLGMPFLTNYVIWTGRTGPHEDVTLLMAMDYAGLDAEAVADESGGAVTIPTSFSGTVIERPLADGRTEVHVRLHTQNALAYVLDYTGQIFGATLFGATPSEVGAQAADPSLGDSRLDLVYIVPREPGGPMEDLVQVAFLPEEGQELVRVSFFASASGAFREASGFGEGALGRASAQQTGLIGAAIRNGFQGALADAFPAEWINLQVTGH